MSLPAPWVDALFDRLTVTYGQRFLGLYAGLKMDAVKADWARELDGLTKAALRHALAHLPAEQPPTVLQFRALARNAPQPAAPALESPKTRADQARLSQTLQRVQGASRSGRECALALARREHWQATHPRDVSRHHAMTAAQRSFWRQVLGVDAATRPQDVLPELAGQDQGA